MAGDAKKKRVARGSKKKKKKKGGARDVVADLTDDVLVDILSLVPVKSLCRCKSVCRRWRDLISHRDHRKKLPQTLAGFFCGCCDKMHYPKSSRHFLNVPGAAHPLINSSLSFLPEYESIDLVDSCNGLLLCRVWKPTNPVTLDYVVCNPATEKWVVIPDSGWSSKAALYKQRIARLGFDPAVSTHFYVFEFIPNYVWHMDDREIDLIDYYTMTGNNGDTRVKVVATFSKTGVWSFKEEHFNWDFRMDGDFEMLENSKGVFFNGVLHVTTVFGMVLAIDVEGNILRGIPVPMETGYDFSEEYVGDVYLSQGHLYYAVRHFSDGSNGYELSVWVLDDYNSENWSLKHNVNTLDLFGAPYYSVFGGRFKIISIHPEHNAIFVVCGCGEDKTLMCYEMDHRRLRFVSRFQSNCPTLYIPYVPLFSGSSADEH